MRGGGCTFCVPKQTNHLLKHPVLFVLSAKGVVAPYRNADRQKAVNRVAYKFGTGTGTAYKVKGATSFLLLLRGEGYFSKSK